MGPVYIFLFIFQAALGATDKFCALQERSVRVTEGENVIIPCQFTYPEDKAKRRQFQVDWFESEDGDCTEETHIKQDKYEGRLSYSNSYRSESITIHNVNKKDGPVICCQIATLPGHFKFFPSHGTHLLFSGQIWVDQLEAVAAQTGGNTIIPCYINYPPGYNTALSGVTWKRGISCRVAVDTVTNEKNNINSRFSLMNFPDDVSLRINNIQEGDGMIYCCSVTISGTEYRSKHATELVIQGSRSHIGPNINQSQESSAPAGGDVTILCSYTIDNGGEYMGKQVYWRAGSPEGPIAYHPSRWMVHPTYKGRTMITARDNLQIQGVTVTDSNTYYCFVILKFCVGNQNITTSINYGPGTRLTVTAGGSKVTQSTSKKQTTTIRPSSHADKGTDSKKSTTKPSMSKTQEPVATSSPQTPLEGSSPVMQTNPNSKQGKSGRTTIIIVTSVVIVVVMLVLCGILIKRKGSCRKKEDKTSNTQPDPAIGIYEEADTTQNRQGAPAMVYAVLNMPALDPGKSKPHQDEEIVYSLIKN